MKRAEVDKLVTFTVAPADTGSGLFIPPGISNIKTGALSSAADSEARRKLELELKHQTEACLNYADECAEISTRLVSINEELERLNERLHDSNMDVESEKFNNKVW